MNELGKDEKNFYLSLSQVNGIFFKKSTLFFLPIESIGY